MKREGAFVKEERAKRVFSYVSEHMPEAGRKLIEERQRAGLTPATAGRVSVNKLESDMRNSRALADMARKAGDLKTAGIHEARAATAGLALRAAKAESRKALVDDHRASEHLFKPAEESTHGTHDPRKIAADFQAHYDRAVRAGATPAEAHEQAVKNSSKWTGVPEHVVRAAADSAQAGKHAVVHEPTREQYRLRDPQKEALARLKQARAEKSIQIGPRGGRHYLLPGGGKRYVKD